MGKSIPDKVYIFYCWVAGMLERDHERFLISVQGLLGQSLI
jgi:hypothetical protein